MILSYGVRLFALIGFVMVAGYVAVRLGLTNTKGIIDTQAAAFLAAAQNSTPSNTEAWSQGPEWQTLKAAITKDTGVIYKAATVADVDPRLVVAVVVPEQLRLFHSDRQLFKEVFAPLKILGNESQFSWGIAGVKQDTAIAIENHLKDSTSPYFPGVNYEHLLDFKTANTGSERFARITDDKNHYYAYLYAALYLKEVMAQWKAAGFDISNRPEILCTLYNIGFDHSKPNASPSVGGAEIDLNGTTYSFGGLGGAFYQSQELRNEFPDESQGDRL